MADEAKFSLRLIDRVSGASLAVRKALGGLRDRTQRMASSVDAASKAVGKFLNKDIRRFTKQGTLARKVLGRLGPALDRTFGTSLRKNMGAASEKAQAMWKHVAGGHLAAKALMAVADFAVGAANAGWEFVKFGQRARLALGQLGKHGATGPKLFELGRALAVKYGQDVEETTGSLQKLLASQFDPKLATDIIKMGADLRLIASDADAAHGAVVAITQIKGAGRLMGQELLQLANAGVSVELVRDEIGKLLGGKSIQEVIKLQESGQIDADTAIQGILNAVQRKTGSTKLGEAGEKFADTTIEGMLGRIKALGQDAALTITERIEAPLTKFVSGKAKRFSEWLESPAGTQAIEKLGVIFEKVIGIVEAFADAAGDTFLSTMRAVADTFGPVLKALGTDGNVAVQVAKTLGKVLGFVAAGLVVAGGLLAGVTAAVLALTGAIVEGAIGAWDWMIEKIGQFVLWLEEVDFGELAMDIGKSIMLGIAKGIGKFMGVPGEAVEQVGNALIGKLKGLLGIHSPSTVFADLGSDTILGYTLGIESGESAVRSAGVGVAEAHLGGTMAGYGLDGATTSSSFGDFTSAALPAPSIDTANVGGGSPMRINIPISVQTGSGDPDEIAHTIRREFRREIDDYFRDFDLEA